MKNKLQKWPRNWVEHVTETCFFYFEYHKISFVDSKILCSNKTKDAKIYGMRLTFQKDGNIYDIFINYECSTFTINYYYKNYYSLRKRKDQEQDFIIVTGESLKGKDKIGLFSYLLLGGESVREVYCSAYEISKSIEIAIEYHTDNGNNGDDDDDDDDDGEKDPIEPFSPSNVTEPELLLC